jgi:hypothetical protein
MSHVSLVLHPHCGASPHLFVGAVVLHVPASLPELPELEELDELDELVLDVDDPPLELLDVDPLELALDDDDPPPGLTSCSSVKPRFELLEHAAIATSETPVTTDARTKSPRMMHLV